MSDVRPAYQGELMLAGWTENHNSGAKVTFWLPDADALESFRHLTARRGKTAGQRFMAVLVQLGDGDEPIQPGTDGPQRESHALSKSAALLCRTDAFQQFACGREGWIPDQADAREELSAVCIRGYCRIESRADLDKSPTAAAMFARLMSEYRDWCRANGVAA